MGINFLKVSFRWIQIMFSFFLFAFASCSNESFAPNESGMTDSSKEVTFQLGDTILLEPHRLASIDNGKVAIKLVEIIDDSRCPTDELILCVWEGQVSFKIDILIVGDSQVYSHIISTSNSFSQQLIIADYQIQYISISPEKRNLDQIDFDDYEVRLMVTNN
ncbi:MAG: hypothetical protein O2887_00185 [Bacteroidetes bacterium]|nr:hypothetical protein [Bacteroidota bacterium]MDA1118907.1 hypothetical protein [Bacteroidota bacterium]